MTMILLAAALAFAGAIDQEKTPAKIPQKGDTIIVKGCLRGSALESTETGLLDSEARMMTALVYRLTGDKSALKQMRQEYDGHVVEATGILKSTLPPADDIRGKTIGRTRIRIGVASPSVGSPVNSEANRSIPVLEVKSYEGFPVKCGG
ncbi:MAG: hypothetical protein WBC51_21920 [Vicinamibacterales bacterium]|jgi:hypothetical protein